MHAVLELPSQPVAVRPAAAPSRLRVERIPARELPSIERPWLDLCARALEPNVFLEPAFALPLMRHVDAARRSEVMLVWAEGSASRRLLALLPVAAPRHARTWAALGYDDALTSLGTPLLDRDRGLEAFSAMLSHLSALWPRARMLVLNRVPEGPVRRGMGGRLSQRVDVLASHDRAVLPRDEVPAVALSAKRRKELARQGRRLAEHGRRSYASAWSPHEVAAATERFLSLEHRGWKGASGTALLAQPGSAAFTREMTGRMAARGLCRIDALEIDGRPVAMGIVLTTGGRAHFWKTAFDETLAALSPGVQFAAELSRVQRADPSVQLTDSCAIAGHPMIDRLWQGRAEMADLAVALRGGGTRLYAALLWIERRRRGLTSRLKSLIARRSGLHSSR